MILHSKDLKDVRVVISAIPPPNSPVCLKETGGAWQLQTQPTSSPIAIPVPVVGSLPGMSLGFQEHGSQPPSRKCLISIPNKKEDQGILHSRSMDAKCFHSFNCLSSAMRGFYWT